MYTFGLKEEENQCPYNSIISVRNRTAEPSGVCISNQTLLPAHFSRKLIISFHIRAFLRHCLFQFPLQRQDTNPISNQETSPHASLANIRSCACPSANHG